MKVAAERSRKKIRADAARNRERLIDAAGTILSAGGKGVSLEAIAREAGVGIGTLYRHFPTREALYETVYRRDIDAIVKFGVELMREEDSVRSLRRWAHAVVDMVAAKKGMIAAFALPRDPSSAIPAKLSGRLVDAIDPLLARAVAEGRLRDEVTGEALLLGLIGMCMLREQAGWQASVARLIDNLIAGMSVDL